MLASKKCLCLASYFLCLGLCVDGIMSSIAQVAYIATNIGVFEAGSASILNTFNTLASTPFYGAYTRREVEWHRSILARQLRSLTLYTEPVGLTTSRHFNRQATTWHTLTEIEEGGEDAVSLTFFVSRAILGEYPSLANTLRPGHDLDASIATGDSPPIIFFIHGGGFVYLNSDAYEKILKRLANRVGAVVVSIDYRRPPDFPFPTPIYDCLAALGWLYENSPSLGLDQNKIVVTGDSAGGNLGTASVSVGLNDPLFFPWSASIRGLGVIYPVVCMGEYCDSGSRRKYADLFFTRSSALDYFTSQYSAGRDIENDWRVQLLRIPHELVSRFPPTMISLVTHDTLRDEGVEFFRKLRSAGIDVTLDETNGIHGMFGSDISTGGDAALTRFAEWINGVI